MAKYYHVEFNIKDESFVNKYVPKRKRIYFVANDEESLKAYITAHHIDCNGAFSYTIEECCKEDLDGQYETDGFYCVVLPKDDVIGKINITERTFLFYWERRVDDAEYAKVLSKGNVLVKANDHKSAGEKAKSYLIRRRYIYSDDYVFYCTTEREEEIEKVKKSENFIEI